MHICNVYANYRLLKFDPEYAKSDFGLDFVYAYFAIMNTIYANIKAIRVAKGRTQEDVAEKLGLAPSNYGRVERGLTELSIDRLEKIAEIFEVSTSYILKYYKENQLDFKEDVEYYYNLSKKLEAKIDKQKKDQEEAEDSDHSIYNIQLKETEKWKDKHKSATEKIKILEATIQDREKTIEEKDKFITILEIAMDLLGKKS